jgi:formate hydrogenlyase subunit 3/multisubunit Na+/H+ antiporter MnhD subunit
VAVVASVISVYLYLRIVVTMWMRTGEEFAAPRPARISVAARVGIAACVAATIFIGLVPGPTTSFTEQGVPAIVQVAPEPGDVPDVPLPGELPPGLEGLQGGELGAGS